MGWVPESALRTGERVESELVRLEASGVAWSPLTPFGRNDPTRYGELEAGARSCAWNAPVAVELQGVTREVGTIASGIPLRLGVEQGGLREVVFDHPYLEVSGLSRFWVPEALLYECPVRDGSSEG